MKFNHALISVVVVLTLIHSCDGVVCMVCTFFTGTGHKECEHGTNPDALKECPNTNKCLSSRITHASWDIRGKVTVKRDCGPPDAPLGCDGRGMGASSFVTCVCEGYGCNTVRVSSASLLHSLPRFGSFLAISMGILATSKF